MLKKDYELIAYAIHQAFYTLGYDNQHVRITAERIADELARHNTRFQREKFMRACLGPQRSKEEASNAS